MRRDRVAGRLRQVLAQRNRGRARPHVGAPGYFLSLIAALTFAAISGGIVVILCAVLACSAPFAITSASSFPSMTALHPGTRSPQFRTFAMVAILLSGSVVSSHLRTGEEDRSEEHTSELQSPVHLV